jgi:hypothetical protein
MILNYPKLSRELFVRQQGHYPTDGGLDLRV